MEDPKKLALLIVNHLKSQLNSNEFTEESTESMEVAVQCIESAYSLNSTETDNVDKKLGDIIKEYYQIVGHKVKTEVKTERITEFPNAINTEIKTEIKTEPLDDYESNDNTDKAEAEYFKQLGNGYMKSQNNEKAIEAYTSSISLNPNNPIYYCNRAAAYNAIGQYHDAIQDCQKAIELDSTYCKAYCRLGLAFSYMKDYHKAVSFYKKACELDPQNMGYQRNYQLTLSNLQAMAGQPSQPQPGNSPGTPNLMETAARLMTDPDVSTVLNNILGDVSGSSSGGLDRLMQVGQTIVTRLQTANPSLLDGLRMQFQNAQNEGQPSPHNGFPDDEN